jgi:hypothetical protein
VTPNNLLLRAMNDKVHAPGCWGSVEGGGHAPRLRPVAAEQGR